MKYLAFLLIIAAGLSSCKGKKQVISAQEHMETDSTSNADSSSISDAFADLEDEFDFDMEEIDPDTVLFASISRGACFGRCPIYKIHVYGSGRAEYHGINFVDSIGVFTTQLETSLLGDMEKAALELGLDKMKDVYDSGVSDLPTTYIGITMNGEHKRIKARHGYPKELKDYATYFDSLFEEVKWTRIENKTSNQH